MKQKIKRAFDVPIEVANVIGFIGIVLIGLALVLFVLRYPTYSYIAFGIGGTLILFYVLHTILDTIIVDMDFSASNKPLTQKHILASANTLIENSSYELLKRQDHNELKRLLGQLDTIKEYHLLGKTVNKLGENFGSLSQKVRFTTAKTFKKLTPAIWDTKSSNMHASFNKVFMDAADQETDKAVYKELADLLEEMIRWSFETGKNRLLSKETIDMLRRHQKVPSETFPERCRLAFKALRKIADKKIVLKLVEMLKSDEQTVRRLGYELTLAITGGWLKRFPKRTLMKQLSGLEYSKIEKLIEELNKI